MPITSVPPCVLIIGSGTKRDHSSLDQNTISVEVVLLDRSHRDLNYPLLYQIQIEQDGVDFFPSWDYHANSQKDSFVMMGEVVKVDTEEKQVILANGYTIKYNFLIVCGGSKHTLVNQAEDFRAGLLAFKEAKRIQQAVTGGNFSSVDSFTKGEAQRFPSFSVIDPQMDGNELLEKAVFVKHVSQRRVREGNPNWHCGRIPCAVVGSFLEIS